MDIEIQDVGPIEKLTIPVPEDGGLVVLKSLNGNGKTHALNAVRSLMGKDRPVSRDGSLGARIDGLGVRLSVARRVTRAGEIAVAHLDGEDPSLLVDPGLKSREAADAQRIRSLCRLAHVSIDPIREFAPLVGGEKALREICREASLEITDVPEQASAIKRDIEAYARKQEQEAKNLTARADGIQRTLDDLLKSEGKDVDFESLPSPKEARARHEHALCRLSEVSGSKESNEKLLRNAEEARDAIEALGDNGTDEAVRQASITYDGDTREVERLRARLQQAEKDLAESRREVERQQDFQARRQAYEKAIDDADGVTAASDKEIEILSAEVDMAREVLESVAIAERTSTLRQDAKSLTEQAKEAMILATTLRQAAQNTESVVTAAVSGICGNDMSIVDGRLMIDTKRGKIPFDELSHGERWRRAIDIAVSAVGEGGLLVVRQEAFESLDPVNRKAIAEHARNRRTVILTAEADDGPLRAEVANA